MVGLPNFRSQSKSRPFATQPLLDHSKSKLGRISDPLLSVAKELFCKGAGYWVSLVDPAKVVKLVSVVKIPLKSPVDEIKNT